MGKNILLFSALFLVSVPSLAVQPPGNVPSYKGRVDISNRAKRPSADITHIRQDAQGACFRVHRALYASTHWWNRIWKQVSTSSINMGVLHKNRSFYEKRWQKRLAACQGGKIKIRTAGSRGYCKSDNGTEAYVKVTFGFVGSTINLCDLYFSGGSTHRMDTMAHEFGRLEDIGDSPNFDRNNIYVWDAITRWLSVDHNWNRLEADGA